MGEAVRQRFQRDVPTQPCVPRAVDFTHSAFAQFRHDLIWTDGPPDHSRGLCWATARPRHGSRGARRSRAEAGPPVPSGDRISYGPRRAPRESVIWRAVFVIRLDPLNVAGEAAQLEHEQLPGEAPVGLVESQQYPFDYRRSPSSRSRSSGGR
jgi:hypothetical protein